MAIAFQSTSISGASAAAAGITAQSAIRDALIDHASGAWTSVEEFDSSGTTIHWVVLKNDKTISLNSADFYLIIGRTVATGQLCFMLGEVYNSGTHTLSSLVPYASSGSTGNTILSDFAWAESNGSTPTSFALGTTFPPISSGSALGIQPGVGSTMRYVSVVEKDYAIINLVTTAIYIGALTDLIVADANLSASTPIGLIDLFNANVGNFGGLTRHPIDAANAPLLVGASHSLFPFVNYPRQWLNSLAWGTGIYLNEDRYQSKRVAASEIAAIMAAADNSNGANNTAAKVGALRGKFKAIRVVTYPAGAVLYDQIVIDGRKHIILKDNGTLNGFNGYVVFPYNYSSTVRYGFAVDTGVAA